MELFEGVGGGRLRNAFIVLAYVLVAFVIIEILGAVQGWRYIGAGVQATNTISVTGHGENSQAPDIATFSFTVSSTKSTVADAQNDAAVKNNAAIAFLTKQGVASKDIQTSAYQVNPHYEYQHAVCPQGSYCPGKQVITGYDVRQTTTVKVRDLAKAGDLLSGVGSKGATEMSQLTFTFDDPSAPQNDARQKAIADARTKADVLAKQLGVSIVRVVSFNENAPGRSYPMAYSLTEGVASAKAVAPDINPGENKTTDDVTITYEIK